jgi:Tfp pilus assembly pilus retraction ATPase PilT
MITRDAMASITDLFLPLEKVEGTLSYPGPIMCYKSLSDHIDKIKLAVISEHKESSRFRISVDGNSYRVTRASTPDGDYLAMRRLRPEIMDLENIGLPSEILRHLRSPGLSEGGLVIVSGQSGNGKSTTCASIIIDQLKNYGGVCNTIEYPIEMMMTGMHGDGLCIQRNVETPEEFTQGISDALRSYPSKSRNVLFIGEILDCHSAAAALKSAIDGHLVFTTMHAGGVLMALERIVSLASPHVGNEEARHLLGSGLRMVIHQKLVETMGRTSLRANFLIDTESAAMAIQAGKSLKQLSTEIGLQKRRLLNGQTIESQRDKKAGSQ